jgi:hypothetical protein
VTVRIWTATLVLTLIGLGAIAAEPPAEPTSVPTGFDRYDDRPPPAIANPEQPLTFYPCSQCHDHWKTNETPRLLAPVHDVALNHGEGRIWCLECHSAQDRNQLRTVRGEELPFEGSWKVCGQCHAARQKDWYYGAHGKRANGWNADPERYNCTHCHNPHQPPFMTRQPKAPPRVRAGLDPMPRHRHAHPPIWERQTAASLESDHHD